MNDKSTMNKVLEYMALGKPVVQFDLQEGRYSCEAASLYAKCTSIEGFAENILSLVNDPEKRKEMGKIGRMRIEEVLSWDHQVSVLLKAYKMVC